MAEDWSDEEVAATVSDYLVMLRHQLRGEAYNKRDHNRRLQALLRGRSAPAIEFKHANISAVLIELGYPYIDGYKPRANYQERLRDEVAVRLEHDVDLTDAVRSVVDADVATVPLSRPLSDLLVAAPVRDRQAPAAHERRAQPVAPIHGVNYLEREARNATLGLAGEEFVLDLERRRLSEGGHGSLADRVRHVSRLEGDGLGYDILSFDADGAKRLIEVKTTGFGMMTPFFASRREVSVSEQEAPRYKLYRVFRFRDTPRAFVLEGSLRQTCVLDAVQFRAVVA